MRAARPAEAAGVVVGVPARHGGADAAPRCHRRLTQVEQGLGGVRSDRNQPTGGVELQCPVGGTPRLIGPLTCAQVETLPPGLTIVGARFWPGAASPLLGVPADELVDQVVPFGAVQGGSSDLAARLAEASQPATALRVLQLELVRLQARTPPPDSLVAEAVRRLMPWRRQWGSAS